MSGFAVLLLLWMLARQGDREPAYDFKPRLPRDVPPSPGVAPAPGSPLAKKASQEPAPWPQVVPAGLPPFGPKGWEPDSPPPLDVQVRASALLPQLWKYGAGTKKTEMTSGRWITYRAEPMGKKKGVVAYRVRQQYLPPPTAPDAPIPSV